MLEYEHQRDVHPNKLDSQFAREMSTPPFLIQRQRRPNQLLLYMCNNIKSRSYDRITLFRLRPVKLLQLVPNGTSYYRWFTLEKETDLENMVPLIVHDICQYAWINGIRHQVLLRKPAFDEFLKYLNDGAN